MAVFIAATACEVNIKGLLVLNLNSSELRRATGKMLVNKAHQAVGAQPVKSPHIDQAARKITRRSAALVDSASVVLLVKSHSQLG